MLVADKTIRRDSYARAASRATSKPRGSVEQASYLVTVSVVLFKKGQAISDPRASLAPPQMSSFFCQSKEQM